jgi:hypothetical protein
LFSGYIFFAISTLLSLLAALQPLALLCHHTASLRHCFIVLLPISAVIACTTCVEFTNLRVV